MGNFFNEAKILEKDWLTVCHRFNLPANGFLVTSMVQIFRMDERRSDANLNGREIDSGSAGDRSQWWMVVSRLRGVWLVSFDLE